MAESLHCPFCGGRPHYTNWGRFGKWAVKHTCKGGSGNGKRISIYASEFDTEEEAIEAWNRRYTPFEVGDTIRIPLPKDKKIMNYQGEEIDFDYAAEDE